jgi:hypothetical protein
LLPFRSLALTIVTFQSLYPPVADFHQLQMHAHRE